ncbi:hypothetical protein Metho_1994 [Methanomethylovorans hollandica DSM 15978]|uniref:DUF4935 domain-containing protein n=1 Tax=Methanomethylovorans hollandica (strain DSM 15978 / NBRC 107637 / DMS1) TaxID=867904 RepID=L0KZQ3_METHD|nr:PIN domain-containing protein [Methanomethylovorans hollandica]AGB50165.1 hypothetical protein Metho_1994 [Methanomethylovorans hollandica DSM 15978]
MSVYSKEESTGESIECFYLFMDTNLFYSETVTYDIFELKLMTDLLAIRDNFNKIFEGYRTIKILIPKLVLDEIYSIKTNIIRYEFNNFIKKIKKINEKTLIASLNHIYNNIYSNLESSGNSFISRNKIEIIPYCDNTYFPTIIEKSITKSLPFKPYFDQRKNRDVGDNGFKDTVIWYSIMDYVKKKCTENTNHIFFLTDNEKDFKSDSTLLEFRQNTGIDIEIIKFKNENPNVNDSEFSPFLNVVLDKSHIPIPVKLEHVDVSYLIINNKVDITSIIVEPLHINIKSAVNFEQKTDSWEENKPLLNEKIENTLSNFRFDVSDLKFKYQIPEIVHVDFDLVQEIRDLVITSISLIYNDGFRKMIFCSIIVDHNEEEYYGSREFEEANDPFVNKALDLVSAYLEDNGYGSAPRELINLEYFDASEIF